MAIISKSLKGVSREDWLLMRTAGLGGSDMGKVLGLSQWGTAVDIWLEKTNRKPPKEDNLSMWIGRYMENGVAERYAEQRGVVVQNHNFMLYDPVHHLIGNIDRLVTAPGTKAAHRGKIRATAGLECKTSALPPYSELPQSFAAQVHTYMALAEVIEVFDIACLHHGQSKGELVFTERYCPDIVAYIRESAREFWEKYIIPDVAPPPQNEEDCKAIWKQSTHTTVLITEDIHRELEGLKEITAQIKELEATASKHKTKIMESMKDADTLTDGAGKNLVTWRTSKDREKVDWKTIATELGATPELIEKHTEKTPGYRTFRVSER